MPWPRVALPDGTYFAVEEDERGYAQLRFPDGTLVNLGTPFSDIEKEGTIAFTIGPAHHEGRQFLTLDARRSAPDVTSAESSFLAAVERVDAALEPGATADTVLHAMVSLRLLLDDGGPRPLMARRYLPEPLRFVVAPETDYRLPGESLAWFDPDPTLVKPHLRLEVPIDGFRRKTVLRSRDAHASVLDVVKACANSLGGAHHGPVRTPGQELVLAHIRAGQLAPNSLSFNTLVGVFRVALRGMNKLVWAVADRTQ